MHSLCCLSIANSHVRQIKRTVEFLITNGVKTLKKLRAIRFEDLIFNNASPQAYNIAASNGIELDLLLYLFRRSRFSFVRPLRQSRMRSVRPTPYRMVARCWRVAC